MKTFNRTAVGMLLVAFNFVFPTSLQAQLCGLNHPIFDNSCTASHRYFFEVTNAGGIALGTDVILEEVRLIVQHTWDSDLDISLRSPSGIIIELSTDNGGGSDHYGHPFDPTCSEYTAFNRHACLSITEGLAPFIGNFRPEGSLDAFNDGSNPNDFWMIQLCDDAANDSGVLKYIELVFSTTTCHVPEELTLVDFDSTAAQLEWQADACLQTIIEYGPPGFTPGMDANPGQGTVVNIPCPVAQPFNLTSLAALTEYDIYLRTACPNGGYTANSCPVSLETNCSTPPLTLFEDFDDQNTCSSTCGTSCPLTGIWYNRTDDNFDWLVDKNGTATSSTGPSDDLTGGGNYLYTESSGSACQDGTQAVLESTCLLVGAAGGDCHLSFYYHLYGVNINTLALEITLDDGQSWQNIWSLSGDQGNEWTRVYLDLSAYHDQPARFRFMATSGDSFRGDIAIDNISFYGATELGTVTTYYEDNDMDGYGNPMASIQGCSLSPPPGYTEDASDCNDGNLLISPEIMEIPCNGIDENCDPSDDNIFPAPFVASVEICSGTSATLVGDGNQYGTLYWYTQPVGGMPLGSGAVFTSPTLEQNTLFYVLDSLDATCFGLMRTEVEILVQKNPDISIGGDLSICLGESVDLSTIDVFDSNNSGGVITFHSASPATATNELSNTIVQPQSSTNYFINSTTPLGCTDEVAIGVTVLPKPVVEVSPRDTTILCRNDAAIFTVEVSGNGLAPYQYLWSDNAQGTSTIIAGLVPGIELYQVSVTDGNACVEVDSFWVETLASLTSVAVSAIDVSICGGMNGAIDLTFLNGTPPYSLQWFGATSGAVNNLSNTFTLNNLGQGSYNLRVVDAGACVLNIPNIIINGPGAVVDPDVEITSVSCQGLSDGQIDISVTGTAPSFLWSNGMMTEDIQNLSAGFYTVTVTDGTCTNVIENIEITQPEAIGYTALVSANSCQGENDGAITLLLTGGTAPYQVAWSNSGAGLSQSNLAAGDYTFTLTDANACSFISNPISLSEPTALTFASITLTEPSCFGEQDGAISLEVSGGTAPYRYFWNTGALSAQITGIAATDYIVTVMDALDCSLNTTLTLDQPDTLAYFLDLQTPSCNNQSDGQIAVMPSGGTPPYTITWEDGATGANRSNIGEGTYQFTLTDGNACTLIAEAFDFLAPQVMDISLSFAQNPTCLGINNGFIDMTTTGGTLPYSYLWNDGSFAGDRALLEAGDYQVTVSDANGCSEVSPIWTLMHQSEMQITLDQLESVSCAGENDGNIFLSLSNGTAPYSIHWNHGASTEDLTALAAGNYWATITDAIGCRVITDTLTIESPAPIEIALNTLESFSCNGDNSGSIDVAVTGGNGGYLYSWNNGRNTEDLSDLSQGVYRLTVVDEQGCNGTSMTFEILEPEKIIINLVQLQGVSCAQPNGGQIVVDVSGGDPAYTYEWSNGADGPILQNLAAGPYRLTVTDAQACSNVFSTEVPEINSDGFTVALDSINHVDCHEAVDGLITVMPLGGTAPYQYNWSNGTTVVINDSLTGGNYQVTLTDANGCTGVSDWITVEEPNFLAYQVTGVVNNDCLGDSTGIISVNVTGGTAPYDLFWSNGDTGFSTTNLVAGEYQVTIVDSRGCNTVSNLISIGEPATMMTLTYIDIEQISCFEAADAVITLTAEGGTLPHQFHWNTGVMTSQISELSPGFYSCTITDANSCHPVILNTEIVEPEALTMDQLDVAEITTCDGVDGRIALSITGGTPPFVYDWNVPGDTAVIENLAAGSYQCTITDANDCVLLTPMFSLSEPENDLILSGESTPATGSENNGSAEVFVAGGVAPLTFQWDANTGNQNGPIATNLAAGIYEVTVTDNLECSQTIEVEVEQITSTFQVLRKEQKLVVFPNPTNGLIQLSGEHLEVGTIFEYQLFDALGREKKHQIHEVYSEKIVIELDLNAYPSGVYLLRGFLNKEHWVTQKIVLQKDL